MNTNSFTDEQLLNVINNQIINKKRDPSTITGGYVQITSSYNHTKTTYKLVLLFGYKNKNSISESMDIAKEYIYIYTNAILLKLASLEVKEIGADINELNELMKKPKEFKKVVDRECSYDLRTTSHLITITISINLSIILLSNQSNFKNFLDVKNFMKSNSTEDNGDQFVIGWKKFKMKIDSRGVPYHADDLTPLSKTASDEFYTDFLSYIKSEAKAA